MINEFSMLATGYSTYGMEVLKRLNASGKYDVAELACYVSSDDPRIKQLPWKVYVNHPDENRRQDVGEYNSKRTNEFGEFAFERTCIKFRPDIVFDIRDWWMCEFEERSPFRPYYKWVIMPTVDAAPQHEQWIATYMNADAVFTYSDWGTEVLRKEGGGLIKTQGAAPPGADTVTFRPMDREQLRRDNGFEEGINVIGTVMRNQGRKLYPELIEAFVMFQKQAPSDMAKKTFLYLHMSYPDQGWDIPRLIKQYGVSHKILVTYKCRKCATVFPSFFMDVAGPCVKCGESAARMPNTQEGVDRITLAKVMNLFDCYVQYANSEGFGMPMVEAASCGLPVFATDYSAMSDVVRKVNGYPIKVDHYRLDSSFGCYRAAPSNQDIVDKWIKFFSLSESERKRKSQQARQGVEKHYTWEQTTNKWMTVFDRLMSNTNSLSENVRNSSGTLEALTSGGKMGLKSSGTSTVALSTQTLTGNKPLSARSELIPKVNWLSPPRIHNPLPVTKEFANNEDLVRWAISNVLGQPELVNSYLSLRLIRDLNWGMTMKNLGGGNYANEQSMLATLGNSQAFTVDDMIRELHLMCENRNKWEERRWQSTQENKTRID